MHHGVYGELCGLRKWVNPGVLAHSYKSDYRAQEEVRRGDQLDSMQGTGREGSMASVPDKDQMVAVNEQLQG